MTMPDLTPYHLRTYDEVATEPPTPQLIETDNPVVATLLGPNGAPLRQWRERPPFGYRREVSCTPNA